MSGTRPIRIWHLLIGFTLWSLLFVGLYGLQGLGCALGWDAVPLAGASLLRLLLGGLYLIGIAGLGALLLVQLGNAGRSRPTPLAFLARGGILATAAALVATLATFAPVLFLTLCN